MRPKLTLYTRKDCCLCDEMKAVIEQIAADMPLEVDEIDVDGSLELREKFGSEVPVLFLNGHKAFKYRVTVAALARKLSQTRQRFFSRHTHC